MRFTREQVAAHEAKFAPRKPTEFTPVDAGQEAGLHRQILDWCRDNHCAVIHSHMHRKSSQTPGSPDFAIAAPGGRTLWVECKTKAGKVDEEQRVWHFLAERHEHTVHVVRSFEEFLSVIRDQE